MNSSWQTPVAFLVVALAVLLLLRSALTRKKSGGCGSDCGCSAADTTAKLAKLGRKPR